jgi:hypothetical protein
LLLLRVRAEEEKTDNKTADHEVLLACVQRCRDLDRLLVGKTAERAMSCEGFEAVIVVGLDSKKIFSRENCRN